MKVLIIEPNRHLLESLTRYFESKKYEVIPAFDSVIGVNEFDGFFDLVIIDVLTPRIQWKETINLLKKKKADLSIFVITDSILIPVDLLVENEMVDEYFTSPFSAYWLGFSIEKFKDRKKDVKPFFTIKEGELLRLIQEKGSLPFSKIDNKLYRIDEIPNLVSALNQKLEGKQIVIEEEGFKLVDKND